jgi:ABC-type lipoprotein release transport system permease subunit
MAIPVVYNLRSVKERWTSAVVAVLGIAGTVGVFIAMLSLAFGFKATLVARAITPWCGAPDQPQKWTAASRLTR